MVTARQVAIQRQAKRIEQLERKGLIQRRQRVQPSQPQPVFTISPEFEREQKRINQLKKDLILSNKFA